MKRTTATMVVVLTIAALGATAAANSTVPESAIDAATAAVPGEVLESEAADDGQAGFEVEIRTADGTVMEVHVDDFGNVIGVEQDVDDGSDDSSDDNTTG